MHFPSERGQGLVEYSLVLVPVAIVVIVVMCVLTFVFWGAIATFIALIWSAVTGAGSSALLLPATLALV